MATAAAVVVELAEAETADLLRALPAAYGASIADALLAALAAALAGPGGAVRVDLEGHGREEVAGEGRPRPLAHRRLVHQPLPGASRRPATTRARRPSSPPSAASSPPCRSAASATACCAT